MILMKKLIKYKFKRGPNMTSCFHNTFLCVKGTKMHIVNTSTLTFDL